MLRFSKSINILNSVSRNNASNALNASNNKLVLVLDTHSVIDDLKNAGFSEPQADGIKNVALNLLGANASIFEERDGNFMLKHDFEMQNQAQQHELQNVKAEMTSENRETFVILKNDSEKFKMELQMLKQNFKDEIDKTNNNLTLNLNLEKSHTRDEYNQVRSEIIKTQNRIDTQVANLRTSFEQYKNDILRYAIGTVITISGLAISVYRFLR